ncbi:LPS export ABC transporter periplasmic protein LptC [Jiella sonneratiae]|uniref:LPS export ABC transporter periplasmic protein LptC n=1 Tax=Jiella sonneratiae TaxID=2816856 RepID=A0ABS3J619_9HYPH|nr:LPS export ABC transporter periplasmic protein LptC [Jiella sonneratiae]MBO0905129.1 LPS export ABC transporter periplasmic protein LptC [Jiella sonneratiae]
MSLQTVEIEPRGLGGSRPAANSPARQAEFARAARHSRLVRALKIGLPVLAAVILLGGLGLIWLARSVTDNVSVTGASIDDGSVVMQDPRMSGVDSKNRPYQLIATRAVQSLDGGGITLDTIQAKVPISDDATAEIRAESGYYDATAGTLQLNKGISVVTTNGISARLAGADIDLSSGTMNANGPVVIKSGTQTIQSQSLKVADSGKLLTFGGRVKMLINPASLKSEASAFQSKE